MKVVPFSLTFNDLQQVITKITDVWLGEKDRTILLLGKGNLGKATIGAKIVDFVLSKVKFKL